MSSTSRTRAPRRAKLWRCWEDKRPVGACCPVQTTISYSGHIHMDIRLFEMDQGFFSPEAAKFHQIQLRFHQNFRTLSPFNFQSSKLSLDMTTNFSSMCSPDRFTVNTQTTAKTQIPSTSTKRFNAQNSKGSKGWVKFKRILAYTCIGWVKTRILKHKQFLCQF